MPTEAFPAPDAQLPLSAFLPRSFTTARMVVCCLPESSLAKEIIATDVGSLLSDPFRSGGSGLSNALSRVGIEAVLRRQAWQLSTKIKKSGELHATPLGATSSDDSSTKHRWKGMQPCRAVRNARVGDVEGLGLFPVAGEAI